MRISKRPFGTTAYGDAVTCWIIADEDGSAVEILDYGVTIRSILVPNRSGNPVDVTLGYDTIAEYEASDGYIGATVGRFANRIAAGRFTLNGKEYTLAVNNGPNHLHGGSRGFDRYVWAAQPTEHGLRFSRSSPDGEEGYPGALEAQVDITWIHRTLTLSYRAVTDADTVVNLTNHSYFNLNGGGNVLAHLLQLSAETFTPNDADGLPTGQMLPVDGTPMDFRRPRAIGQEVDSPEDCVRLAGGYDANFVLTGSPAAVLFSPESGITLTVTTDQPGMQVYSANFLTPHTGKNGVPYDRRSGLCLETQHFPDSPNHPEWPTTLLRPGEVFRSTTSFRFGTACTGD